MTEIEVEGVGTYRLPNDWEYGPPGPPTGRETAHRGPGLRVRHDGPSVRHVARQAAGRPQGVYRADVPPEPATTTP